MKFVVLKYSCIIDFKKLKVLLILFYLFIKNQNLIATYVLLFSSEM